MEGNQRPALPQMAPDTLGMSGRYWVRGGAGGGIDDVYVGGNLD